MASQLSQVYFNQIFNSRSSIEMDGTLDFGCFHSKTKWKLQVNSKKVWPIIIDRSLCELFKTINSHGPKIPLPKTWKQGKFFKKIHWWITVVKKVPKLYFQSQFSMSKINRIFQKKNSFKNINSEEHFLLKTFFLNHFFLDSIFEPLYFLKLCPIFDELTFLVGF